jgi:hypothetical protein
MTTVESQPAILVEEFWANRSGASIRVELREWNGRMMLDVRKHSIVNGRLESTGKGISIVVTRLPELAKAIDKALTKARELGLVKDGDG